MLQARNITFKVKQKSKYFDILKNISLDFESDRLHALIGPSGCGKSTLINSILKLNNAEGDVYYNGTQIKNSNDLTGKVGTVPQFSIAYEQLTVFENLDYSRKLFNPDADIPKILNVVGLSNQLDNKVSLLSGGQRRRLSLALELINNPSILICDEVTSGLDPQSELEILQLLRSLTKKGITVICIIHNLAQLKHFDTINVLKEGELYFQGSYQDLLNIYNVTDPTLLYSNLTHKDKIHLKDIVPSKELKPYKANFQLFTLLSRRFNIFFSDKSQLALTCILTFGFPLLVVIFALNGIPQIEGFGIDANYNVLERMTQEIEAGKELLKTGSLISGLAIFQVILLTLMGSNNGSREIANEINIFKKEKFLGLNPVQYVLGKVIFLFVLSLVQGVWMTAFVKYICHIPGDFIIQSIFLVLTVFAMSLISLAVSAFASTSEKSSLICTYFVGFQLPLSGIVLALPESLIWFFRPFISTYWGWSGYVYTLKSTRFYDAIVYSIDQFPSLVIVSLLVLVIQILVSIVLTLYKVTK